MTLRRPAWLMDVIESLRTRPGWVGLACFSITVGMAALCLLIAVLGGVRLKTRQMVADLGVNVWGLVQQAGEASPTHPVLPLTRRHVECLQAALPGADVTGLQSYESRETGLPDGTLLLAADERLCRVRPWRLVAGRLLDAEDLRSCSRRAVISTTLARELGVMPGGVLRLRDQPFQVIGVIEVGGTAAGDGGAGAGYRPGERVVVVPASLPPYWLTGETAPKQGLDAVFVRVAESARFRSAMRRAQNLFSQPDLRVDPVTWVTPEMLAQRWARYQRTVSAAGGGLAALCLLMGGVTLMSLLLADVRERIPEIGLRRSLGASRADIGVLFLAESLCITLGSSVAGVMVAGLGLAVFGGGMSAPWAWGGWCVAAPLLTGLVLGTAFSYLPARQAAALPPADALRNE
jgi:putative ABC transport system permease protein